MKYRSFIKICSSMALTALLTSLPAFAVQPMTEYDLEDVSAELGDNVLNVLGAPGAGLIDDPDSIASVDGIDQEKHNESDEAAPIAEQEIRELEEKNIGQVAMTDTPILQSDESGHIVESSQQRSFTSDIFKTTSEMTFQNGALKHEMRLTDNGGVSIQRELAIDMLKLENLRGDYQDRDESAGSIYLSNWRSYGETRIVTQD